MEELSSIDSDQSTALAPVAPSAGATQMTTRGFAGSSLAISNAQTDALVAKARADIEARWIMAMRQPRNLDDVRVKILAECNAPDFAKAAVYARPVGGGKVAEGLSIRFAETAIRIMGNADIETSTVIDTQMHRLVRVTVTDFETNTTWRRDISIAKTVERKQLKKGQKPLDKRVNSYGDEVFVVEATDDEVLQKESNLVSKTSRTGILRLIPGDIQRLALARCKAIQRDAAAKDPDGERRQILDAFAVLHVMPSDLEQFLGHPTAQLVPVEIERLRSVYSGIREGETSWREVLEAVLESRAAAKDANTKQSEQQPAAAPAPQTQASAAPAPAAAPQTTQAAPAVAPAPAVPPVAAPERKARGAAGLKSELQGQKPPTSFDRAAEQARAKDQERAATPKADDGEEHHCIKCGVPIAEAGQCYACSQS